jgi:two-component system cell cycle response regulator DivK
MSNPFSSEHLACIRNDAQHLAEGARDHEDQLDGLVRTADGIVHDAAAMSVALARSDVDSNERQRLCSDQVRRSVENAEATRRACVSAREQHVSAHRLYTSIDNECVDGQELAASRATPVLVVDDAQDVRDLIAIVLRNAGFVVRTAGNGLEALLAAYEMKPAVIVMDVTMPVLDGIEATRLIKATEGIRESKVIAHTGNGSIPALHERWFVAVLPKPSPPEVVLAAVQNAASV